MNKILVQAVSHLYAEEVYDIYHLDECSVIMAPELMYICVVHRIILSHLLLAIFLLPTRISVANRD